MIAQALLLDLGNHNLKWAQLGDDGLFSEVESCRLEEFAESDLPAFLGGTELPVFLSSVNPGFVEQLMQACSHLRVHSVDQAVLPFKVASANTGSDRVIAAFAAWRRCGGVCLVADLGTAWTLDVVAADGVLLGGAIGAGLGVQQAALAAAAPHLGSTGIATSGIPADTETALAVGSVTALALGINALADQFLASLSAPSATRFLGGGDAPLIHAAMGDGWERCDNLVIAGLAEWAKDEV